MTQFKIRNPNKTENVRVVCKSGTAPLGPLPLQWKAGRSDKEACPESTPSSDMQVEGFQALLLLHPGPCVWFHLWGARH